MKMIVALMLGLFSANAAFADGPLTATLEAHKVVSQADGRETFASADAARPHDVIEYRTVYRNVSKSTLRAVAATLPVPNGFVFIAGSAGKNAEASLDGKTYARVPLTRVVRKDGRDQVVPVPLAEYRFLRWQLGNMPANTTNTVIARMRMNDEPAVMAAAR